VSGFYRVEAPGPGAAAYSASKAALTQLARVAALEWAGAGIRVNVLHPDAVFDTGIWTPEVLAARAASYGLTVEQYKRKNLLHMRWMQGSMSARQVVRTPYAGENSIYPSSYIYGSCISAGAIDWTRVSCGFGIYPQTKR